MSVVKKRINSKNKGSGYERELITMFKSLGFKKAQSTRATSRVLDNCKVDINYIPYLVQAKCGYATARPKYTELKKECVRLIIETFPEDEAKLLLKKPYVLFHKVRGKDETVSIDRELFMDFVDSKAFKTFCEDNFPEILNQYNDTRIL